MKITAAVMKLILKILGIILAGIVLAILLGELSSDRKWIGDEPTGFLGRMFDTFGNYFQNVYEDIYGNEGDGTAVTSEKYNESMEAMTEIAGDAYSLLNRGVEKVKSTFPDLNITWPDLSAPQIPNATETVTDSGTIVSGSSATAPSADNGIDQSISNYANTLGLTVEFIDVGQADCILVYTGSNAMLIDAGNNEDGPLVAAYLLDMGIDHLNYAIGTHAHEDHIGGMDDVLEQLYVDNIMLPLVDSTTSTYEDVLDQTAASFANKLVPAVGNTYTLGDASFTVMSCEPADDPDNLNESSIVLKLVYNDTSFLFTGDAEKSNEYAMLDAGLDLDCDILKVGHHGSYTSSSDEFLAAVSPAVAVISCGANNEYGHPHDVTMAALDAQDAAILRTDLSGTICINTDGSGYTITTKETNTDGYASD